MPAAVGRARALTRVMAMALVGVLTGWVFGCVEVVPSLSQKYPVRSKEYPLPHQVAKYPGGVSLRYAMVHDVLHERFARHGRAYYAERNRRVRKALREEAADPAPGGKASEQSFALMDDLGAGLDRLGEEDEAVRVLRDKRKKQEAQGFEGRKLYTTYANLGTFLIHGNFRRAVAGDREARERLREGLALIHRAIEVNPQAHFGREIWQAVTVEFLLAALDNSRLLLKYDLTGNRLDAEVDRDPEPYTRKVNLPWRLLGNTLRAFLKEGGEGHGENQRAWLRSQIPRVGAEGDWSEEAKTSHDQPTPFDEPTLGIIGMWRLGGGANPHFALALGEIMWRVGQRHIAWSAYERAIGMADRFWPDKAIQEQFMAHCRRRQAALEELISPAERHQLRPRFRAELDYGLRYQHAYQQFEAEQIARGRSIDDPHFYDAFRARHGPIASPVANADTAVVRTVNEFSPPLAAILLFAGLFAFARACDPRLRAAKE